MFKIQCVPIIFPCLPSSVWHLWPTGWDEKRERTFNHGAHEVLRRRGCWSRILNNSAAQRPSGQAPEEGHGEESEQECLLGFSNPQGAVAVLSCQGPGRSRSFSLSSDKLSPSSKLTFASGELCSKAAQTAVGSEGFEEGRAWGIGAGKFLQISQPRNLHAYLFAP